MQILDFKIAGEKVDVDLPRTPEVEIVDRAVPVARPISPNLPQALALMAFGVQLNIAGLLMFIGRPGAGTELGLA